MNLTMIKGFDARNFDDSLVMLNLNILMRVIDIQYCAKVLGQNESCDQSKRLSYQILNLLYIYILYQVFFSC